MRKTQAVGLISCVDFLETKVAPSCSYSSHFGWGRSSLVRFWVQLSMMLFGIPWNSIAIQFDVSLMSVSLIHHGDVVIYMVDSSESFTLIRYSGADMLI